MRKLFSLIIIIILILFSNYVSSADQPIPIDTPDEDKPELIIDKPTTLVYPSFWHTPFGIHRGTPFWLKVFLGNRTYFNNPQDLAATKLIADYGKINEGKDDWQLTVYGINSGNSEIIYNPSMYSLAIFGKEGHGDGEFFHPIGIACNEYGDVYVADAGNNRIVRLYNDGKKIIFIRTIGVQGTDNGEFNNPTYVALDSMGRIYVSDTGNNRIQVFDKSGGFLYSIDKSYGISSPQGIAICDMNERYNGYNYNFIYLIDGNNSRIQKLDFKGNLSRSIRVNELLNKKVFLTTLEQDYYGNVYVVDELNSQVHKFSPELFYITSFGKYGMNDYEFENPTGIAIYKHYGQIFVSDKNSAQYFWVGSDVINFKVEKDKIENDMYKFEFFLTEKSYATIEVETEKNIIEVCNGLQLDTGKNSIKWKIPKEYIDKYLKKGNLYVAVIKVSATYSSYPHIQKVVKNNLLYE